MGGWRGVWERGEVVICLFSLLFIDLEFLFLYCFKIPVVDFSQRAPFAF